MKKVYEKPIVIFENFSLATSIASDCNQISDTQSRNQCGFDFSGVLVFMSDMDMACKDIQVENNGGDGYWNGICYHVPADNNNLFNS